ncbi:MAG: hypothetical protein ACTTH0_05645 [Eubacteriales bacterium]
MKKFIFLLLFSISYICIFPEEWYWTSQYSIETTSFDNVKLNLSVILTFTSNDCRAEDELQARDVEINSFLISFLSHKKIADFSDKNIALEEEIICFINDNILTSSRIQAVNIIQLAPKQESEISAYGYKEFKWGMSVDDVKAKCKDFEEEGVYNDFIRWRNPEDVLSYFRKKELLSYAPNAPNPLDYETGKIKEYRSRELDLIFYFVSGKLRAVHISTMGNDIYSAVVKKYGQADKMERAAGRIVYHIAAWKDKGRIILWEDGIWGLETLEYIDAEWLNPLIEKAMAEYLQKDSAIKSRID